MDNLVMVLFLCVTCIGLLVHCGNLKDKLRQRDKEIDYKNERIVYLKQEIANREFKANSIHTRKGKLYVIDKSK